MDFASSAAPVRLEVADTTVQLSGAIGGADPTVVPPPPEKRKRTPHEISALGHKAKADKKAKMLEATALSNLEKLAGEFQSRVVRKGVRVKVLGKKLGARHIKRR